MNGKLLVKRMADSVHALHRALPRKQLETRPHRPSTYIHQAWGTSTSIAYSAGLWVRRNGSMRAEK